MSSLQEEVDAVGEEVFVARDYKPGLVRHVVLFRYRSEVGKTQRELVLMRFRELLTSAHLDGKPYIKSIEAGEQAGGEGVDADFDHGVVVTFASEGDRNYYVGAPLVLNEKLRDGRHEAFKRFVGPLLASGGVIVFDIVAAP